MRITEPGLYDLTADVYHSDPVAGGSLSPTRAKVLLDEAGPAKYRYRADHGQPPKAEFDLGHAAHKLVLGKGEIIAEVEADSWRTKAAQEARDAAREAGMVPLLSHQMRQAEDMAEALSKHPLAAESLAGRPEVAMFWRDTDGLWLRGQADVIADGWTTDYKTCQSASSERFIRDVWRYRYYMQAAWYRRLRHLITGELLPYRIVAQEKDAPYLVSVWEPTADYLSLGLADMTEAVEIYRRCIRTGTWPGYPHELQPLTPPDWAMDDDIEIGD